MIQTAVPLLAASVLCVSCDYGAIEPSQSLVGAKELPSAKALARESVYLLHDGEADVGNRISYEVRPEDTLIVEHTFLDERSSTGPVVRGRETIRISPEAATQIRQLLWRVRPAKLEGLEQHAMRPVGCERERLHDFGEVTVGFVKEGDAPGTGDDQVGIFELPRAESCNTRAAVEARAVIWRALRLLPKTRVAATFGRRG